MIWKIGLALFGAVFFFSLGVIIGKSALRDEIEAEEAYRRWLLETSDSCDERRSYD